MVGDDITQGAFERVLPVSIHWEGRMTLEQAKTIAAQQTTPHLVWRMPKWPAGVYGVIAERPMPSEAEIIKVEPTGGQGSLF